MVFAAFVWWQSRIKAEPLVPLGLFRDRNFSLGNAGIALVSLAITSMSLPFFFYAQGVRGWSPTESALLMAPMAVVLMILSPFVGKLVDRVAPAQHHAGRLRHGGGRDVLAVAAHRARHPGVAAVPADGAVRRLERLPVGAAQRHRDPQPADGLGRVPAPASTTRPARSARCSAARRSPRSSRPA